MVRFGEIIRKARLAKGLSLGRAAKKSRTFKGYLSGIETGSHNPPSPRIIRSLCRTLDLDYDQMLARSVFEKLPDGTQYHALKRLLDEAAMNGQSEAKPRR